METKKSKKGIILFAVILALCAAVAVGIYFITRPAAVAGEKTVTIVMDAGSGAPETKKITTQEEYLGPLLVAENLAGGDVSEFGLFITQVNGVEANADNQEWWCITKGGEEVLTGADDTPLADGDQFELTLTIGF